MPSGWVPGNDDLGDPGFKLWLRGASGRGGGGQRPGPGGGFAAFGGGMNTLGGGSALGAPAFVRRTPYQNAGLGLLPAVGALGDARPFGGMMGRLGGGLPAGGLGMQAPQNPMGGMRQAAGAGQFSTSPLGGPTAAPDWGQGTDQPSAPSSSSQGSFFTPDQEAQIARASGAHRLMLIARFIRENQANPPAGSVFGQQTADTSWGGRSNNTDPGWAGDFWRTLGPFGAAGAFGPMGNPQILDELQRRGNMQASSAANRSRLQSQMLGLDPAAAASYAMESQLRGQGSTADAVANAQYDQLNRSQDWARQLLQSYLAPNLSASAEAGASHNMAGGRGSGGSGWGQFLGGVGGSFLGPLGAYAGSRLGGRL